MGTTGIDQEIMESETLSDADKDWWHPGRKVAICDVGRSVEATLIELNDARQANILHCESGLPYVGGSSIDNILLDKILYNFEKNNKMDLKSDPMSYTRVTDAVIEAKHELSTKLTAEINLPYITADATGPKHLIETIKRAQYERDVDPVVQGILAPIRKLVKKAEEFNVVEGEKTDVPKPLVVVVGGCARSEHLRDAITKSFGNEWDVHELEMPEEAVVTGAAVLAARGAGWK